jgi:cephalosporin-C deacetylase-like acetyl esterase
MLLMVCASAPPEDLNCLSDSERGQSALYAQLQQEAAAALDRRGEAYEQLKTPDDIRAYQQRLREFFIRQLGGLPERTPLNAQTVGTIDADGYRIEKVIFESQPQHHVTANLYLPDGDGPFPCVAVSSGHSRTAKTAAYNQRFGIMLAREGMAALCFDPIGQGERSQILDAGGQPQFSGTTTEHFLIGVGSILVGRNTARYRIWDAMRAIDYLTSRPEIDPQRIGFTGCSGGGTLTSYVMALDDRVTCAAPACYLTTFQRLIDTIGPQDAEQNIYGQIAFGLDQPDYVLLRAPQPTLISATTGDFFDIDGTWDNYRQAKRIYTRLGRPEQVDLVEVEGPHGVKPENLAAIAQWMQRWLLDRDDPVAAVELPVRPEQELLCTKAGQVLRLPGEKSVFDLNAEREAELAALRQKLWKETPPVEMADRIRALLGVRPNDQLPKPTWDDIGRVQRDGYHIDKLVLHTDTSALPALTYHPPEPRAGAYLYLHEDGKLADGAPGGEIEKLVQEGYVVVAVDLRGCGETASDKPDKVLGNWKTYYLAYLLGKPLVGLQVEDALAAAHFVAYYETKQPREVHLVGVGEAGLAALHAAALRPELFTSVRLRNVPRDWASVVRESAPTGRLTGAVHGALEVYDLPDLARLAGADKVQYAEGSNSMP